MKLYELLSQYWEPKRKSRGQGSETKLNPNENDTNKEEQIEKDKQDKKEGSVEQDKEEGHVEQETQEGQIVQQKEPQTPEANSKPAFNAFAFPPYRTPRKGDDPDEKDDERLDGYLAWTLGGELPDTMPLGSPWECASNFDPQDELQSVEDQLKQLEFLVGKQVEPMPSSSTFYFVLLLRTLFFDATNFFAFFRVSMQERKIATISQNVPSWGLVLSRTKYFVRKNIHYLSFFIYVQPKVVTPRMWRPCKRFRMRPPRLLR